jgi:hypothetical protein
MVTSNHGSVSAHALQHFDLAYGKMPARGQGHSDILSVVALAVHCLNLIRAQRAAQLARTEIAGRAHENLRAGQPGMSP